jgi:hypothetical protein
MRPNIQRLRELFTCDAENGILRWGISARGIVKGAEAGSAKNKGRYRYVGVDGTYITVATIIWALHYGEWPASRLASKSGDASDCRISNLVPQKSLSTAEFDHSTSEGRAAYGRAHRKEYPDVYRDKELRKTFGLTLAQYNQMSADQEHVCAICEKPETATRNGKPLALHVDHDHETGKVRSLLCGNCNVALGMFCDDPDVMRNAIIYLAKHRANRQTPQEIAVAAAVARGPHRDWLQVATPGFGA